MFPDQPAAVECAACKRPGRARLCPGCVTRTDADLAALPRLYGALGDTLAPGAGRVDGSRVSGSRLAPLPVRLEPLSLRAHGGIVQTLHSWEDDWRDILGWTARPFRGSVEQAVTGSAGFLRVNLPWCADAHPSPGDFVREINQITLACRLQVYGPGDARKVGVCPAVADDALVCGAALWANPYAEKIECPGCHRMWKRGEWMELGRLMRANSRSDSLDSAKP